MVRNKSRREIALPALRTKYYYIRCNYCKQNVFNVMATQWQDLLIDRRRYANGNFYLDLEEAAKICNMQNETLSLMPPQKKDPFFKPTDNIVL